MRKRVFAVIGAVVLGGVVLGACQSGNSAPSAVQANQNASASILKQYNAAQPVPQFNYSQLRQTLIDIETAQAHTTQTTTFFYNMGVAQPVMSCPSIGFPVASTDEITDPQQTVQDDSNNGASIAGIPQNSPNGIYSGDSTGTYVLCVGANTQTYGVYWEGFVYAVTGPAVVNSSGQVQTTGPTSFHFRDQRERDPSKAVIRLSPDSKKPPASMVGGFFASVNVNLRSGDE